MRTPEFLRYLANSQRSNGIASRLLDAAQSLEDQRLWREAWIRAEKRVEELTEELKLVRSGLTNRKEKEDGQEKTHSIRGDVQASLGFW